MTTIGTLKAEGEGYVGEIRTITIRLKDVRITAVTKPHAKAPDFRNPLPQQRDRRCLEEEIDHFPSRRAESARGTILSGLTIRLASHHEHRRLAHGEPCRML